MKIDTLINRPVSVHPLTAEVEAKEFSGQILTPISRQNIAAFNGTQYIDKESYRLTIDGMVEHPLSLSYFDLQSFTQISQLAELNCVEGWNFTAKWTGPLLGEILDKAKVKSNARIAIFYTTDAPEGYSSMNISYIFKNRALLALKDNDITLAAERGFPFRVVAGNKHKWAKWVTRIELSSDTSFRGVSENSPYNALFCKCHFWFPWWPW